MITHTMTAQRLLCALQSPGAGVFETSSFDPAILASQAVASEDFERCAPSAAPDAIDISDRAA